MLLALALGEDLVQRVEAEGPLVVEVLDGPQKDRAASFVEILLRLARKFHR